MARQKRQRQSKGDQPPQSRVRIIGGQWRSRLIGFPSVDGLRPTGDRVRETLFNWLGPHLANSRCLDAFAGSGALGFEALSRGAKTAVFIEQHPQAAKILEQNKALLEATNASIIRGDTLSVITDLAAASNEPLPPFDIVFLDPPFSAHLHTEVIARLIQFAMIAPKGLLYLEKPVNETVITAPGWQLFKEKCSGSVCYQLWICD